MLSHPPEAEAYNSHKATSHGAPAICSVEEAALLVRLHQQNQLLTTQGFPSLPATSSPTPADVKSTLDIVSSLLASLNEAHQALDASTEQSARTRNDRAALQQRVERLTKDLARRDRKEEDGRVELADTKRALAKERERVKALETALKRARDEALVKGSECHGCGARKGGKGGFGWGIACGRCIDVVRDQGRWRQVERSWEDSLDERDGVYWDEVDGCYYYLDEEQEGDVVELGWSGDEREQLEAEIGMEVIPEEDTQSVAATEVTDDGKSMRSIVSDPDRTRRISTAKGSPSHPTGHPVRGGLPGRRAAGPGAVAARAHSPTHSESSVSTTTTTSTASGFRRNAPRTSAPSARLHSPARSQTPNAAGTPRPTRPASGHSRTHSPARSEAGSTTSTASRKPRVAVALRTSSSRTNSPARSEISTNSSNRPAPRRRPNHPGVPSRPSSPARSEASTVSSTTTSTTASSRVRKVQSTADLQIIRTLYKRIHTLEQSQQQQQQQLPEPLPTTTTGRSRRVSFSENNLTRGGGGIVDLSHFPARRGSILPKPPVRTVSPPRSTARVAARSRSSLSLRE